MNRKSVVGVNQLRSLFIYNLVYLYNSQRLFIQWYIKNTTPYRLLFYISFYTRKAQKRQQKQSLMIIPCQLFPF